MINLLAERFRSPELAIDLGTAVTRVASRCGSVRVQPSLNNGRQLVAGGVVVDTDATIGLLEPLLWENRRFSMRKTRAVACTPTDTTAEEREAMTECIFRAGAKSVALVPEPVAAAVGAGIDIGSGRATFIVDLGEGVTDCAVIQRGRVVQSSTVRMGCSNLRMRVKKFARQFAHLELAECEAERLLRTIGFDEEPTGKLACTGLRQMRVQRENLPLCAMQQAIRPALAPIVDTISFLLRDLPSDLAIEIIEDGIYLSGGGALLNGIRRHISGATNVDVHIVKDPLASVVLGAREMIPYVNDLAVVHH